MISSSVMRCGTMGAMSSSSSSVVILLPSNPPRRPSSSATVALSSLSIGMPDVCRNSCGCGCASGGATSSTSPTSTGNPSSSRRWNRCPCLGDVLLLLSRSSFVFSSCSCAAVVSLVLADVHELQEDLLLFAASDAMVCTAMSSSFH